MQSAIPSQLGLTHRSGSLQESLAGKALLVIGATVFVAACAHISLPLSAMVLYLAEGALGLPVFTPSGGPAGMAHLLGPNGGFLFSYPLAAAAAGWVVRAMQPMTLRFTSALIASTAATLPIFLLGAGWFAYYAHHSVSATWSLAVAPFIPGEIVKIPAAAGIFSSIQRWRQS